MMNLAEFNNIVKVSDNNEKRLDLIQKHIFHGLPFVFNERENDYFEFRKRIANKFEIGFHEVFIVGSAKLGFSYYKGTEFNFDSDIDVVLVNENLFEDFYLKIREFQYQLDRNMRTIDFNELNQYNKFLSYLVKGWMRPDLLPTSFKVDLIKNDWFDFFLSISNKKSEVGNYRVAGGLYKNYEYLEKYYIQSIEELYKKLKNS